MLCCGGGMDATDAAAAGQNECERDNNIITTQRLLHIV